MSTRFQILNQHRFARRAFAVVASIAINAVLSAGVLGLFHTSSSLAWLTPSTDNVARLARCDKDTATTARRACVVSVVEAVQQRSTTVQVAKQSSSTQP